METSDLSGQRAHTDHIKCQARRLLSSGYGLVKSLTDLQSDAKVSGVKLTRILASVRHTHTHTSKDDSGAGPPLYITLIPAEMTADRCDRNYPAGLFSLVLLLQITQRGMKRRQ